MNPTHIVVSRNHMPARLPLAELTVLGLCLDKLNSNQVVWVAYGCLVVLIVILWALNRLTELPVCISAYEVPVEPKEDEHGE